MSLFVLDVESDGPCPGIYSMISLALVRVDHDLKTTFYGEMRPISDKWIEKALHVSCPSRAVHEAMSDPAIVMRKLVEWVAEKNLDGRPVIISDNPAYDWQFLNYYLHLFTGDNPFGHSARRVGDLWAGFQRDAKKSSTWKSLRKTKHTHHPVDDARGVAESLLAMHDMGLKIPGLKPNQFNYDETKRMPPKQLAGDPSY